LDQIKVITRAHPCHHFHSSPNFWATSVILNTNFPQKNRPAEGENSPKLVTPDLFGLAKKDDFRGITAKNADQK
jgi:hypothetical protein